MPGKTKNEQYEDYEANMGEFQRQSIDMMNPADHVIVIAITDKPDGTSTIDSRMFNMDLNHAIEMLQGTIQAMRKSQLNQN